MKIEELNKTLTDLISKELVSRRQTVAVAESVTAGQLQTCLSLADKALDFFEGGLTAYNIGQKAKHLEVDPIHAAATNCVSEIIASKMANQVAISFGSNWGIGITGYASPVPEKNIEELFACFAISLGQQIIFAETIRCKKQSPLDVRLFYTKQVLQKFHELIRQQ